MDARSRVPARVEARGTGRLSNSGDVSDVAEDVKIADGPTSVAWQCMRGILGAVAATSSIRVSDASV